MELKEHISILRKHQVFIVVFTVLLALSGFILGYTTPVRYKASVAFMIVQVSQQVTTDYTYDEYYALRSAELIGQNVLGWFLTPSFLVGVYNTAGVGADITSLERFSRRFKAKQYSPQNIVVTFSDPIEDTARKLADAVIQNVEKGVKELDQSQTQDVFEIRGAEPVVIVSEFPLWLTTLAGFITGLVGGIICVYIVRYFQNP